MEWITHQLQDEQTWVAVAFLIFLLGAAKFAFPTLGKQLDSRAEKIQAEIEEAQRLKEEAQTLFAEAQRKLQEADRGAQEIIERARFESKQIADDAEKEIEREMDRKIKLAEEKIARAEASALESVRTRAIEAGMEAAKNTITSQLTGAKAKAYIQSSAEQISKKIA
jgi:F-type H+-transporting ATPase subunit b